MVSEILRKYHNLKWQFYFLLHVFCIKWELFTNIYGELLEIQRNPLGHMTEDWGDDPGLMVDSV
jgi:hypothetical protein